MSFRTKEREQSAGTVILLLTAPVSYVRIRVLPENETVNLLFLISLQEGNMKVGFGNDHTGVELKKMLMAHLTEKGYECVNYGNDDPNDRTDDYPVPGRKVAEAIRNGEVDQGVLICGTGVGISLAANKVPGIRACACSEPYTAMMTKRHNNANIIAMGSRVVGSEMAKMIVDAFFDAKFEGGRHQRRIDMLTQIEKDYSC
jgi:ribose 5-phosphate isomerase B